jgi:hypothetical protein
VTLEDILDQNQKCLFALVEIARITEYTDFEKALSHYIRALEILEA